MKKLTVLVLSASLTMVGFADAHSGKAHHKHIYKDVKPAAAEEPVSPITGTFDLTSNYVFRGISNSNNIPAVQGGLTYTFLTSGVYLNVWGSNVNFFDANGNQATLELDTIAGIANNISENLKYDLNIAQYNYPKASQANYAELNATLIWRFLKGQLGYSRDVYNTGGKGVYYNLGANYTITDSRVHCFNDVTLSGGVGHYSLPRNKGLLSYNDYNVQVSKTFGIYTLAAQWTDTNRRSVDANSLKNSKLIGTVTATF